MPNSDAMHDCNLKCMAATVVDFSPMPKQSGNIELYEKIYVFYGSI